MRSLQVVLVGVVLILAAACGGSTATSPTPTPASTNHAPSITAMTVSPSFGVSGLTSFSMTGAATDPDGDPVTYQWSYGGASSTGSSASAILTGDGNVTVTLTVTDSKGASARDSRTVAIGTMTGKWAWSTTNCGNASRGEVPAIFTLTQTGGTFTGTVDFPGPFCNIRGTNNGYLHPNAPGTIDDQGNVNFPRVVAKSYQEFNLKGKMDSTGRRIVGAAGDSGFSAEPFSLVKQ